MVGVVVPVGVAVVFVVVDGFTGCNTYVMSRMRLGCNILEHFTHPARNVFDCFRVHRPTARMQQGCNHQTYTDNDTFQDAVGMQEFPHPGACGPTFHKSQTKPREPRLVFFVVFFLRPGRRHVCILSASWGIGCNGGRLGCKGSCILCIPDLLTSLPILVI